MRHLSWKKNAADHRDVISSHSPPRGDNKPFSGMPGWPIEEKNNAKKDIYHEPGGTFKLRWRKMTAT